MLYHTESGEADLEIKNKITVGDELELITPEGNEKFKVEAMQTLKGESIDVAPGSGWKVRIKLPRPVGDKAMLTRMFEPTPVETAKEIQ